MSYLVIDVDGALHVRDAAPSGDTIDAEVGWWDTVRLTVAGGTMRGFVSDTGLVDGSPRNVVGSLLLAACGGPEQPYAGPVVVTGWDSRPYGDESEIRGLPEARIRDLTTMHQCITRALAGDDSCPTCTDGWRQAARETADMVRTAPTPTIQILHLDDLGRS